jgi:hypothetical protein
VIGAAAAWGRRRRRHRRTSCGEFPPTPLAASLAKYTFTLTTLDDARIVSNLPAAFEERVIGGG